ncbi:MAG: orotidine-5'-phosphate decarboxylase [Bacteroidetes bacterium]|jgi:orotidine-5'-phosphate decarboxylase|nr:orotidine-5'-phosphate decarboxylase [Bacteroidota bacterium]
MNYQELVAEIKRKKSFLCVGLDTDINKIPHSLIAQFDDPVVEFNRQIIEATLPYAVAYKLNFAFYEARGPQGLVSLERTMQYLHNKAFTIADAKRGDIGNTAAMYAQSVFDYYKFNSVTLSPYMGADTIEPFLKYKNHWSIVLALTSNPGADDFEMLQTDDGKIYERVLKKFAEPHHASQVMFVAGATRPETFATIRKHAPDHFLLVPGVGAQGGSLEDVCRYGLNSNVGLLINSSRQIIYASSGDDFAVKAGEQSLVVQKQMQQIMQAKGII